MKLPILPLPYSQVSFPGLVHQLTVNDTQSIRMINDILASDKLIGLFAVREIPEEKIFSTPLAERIYTIGCKASIIKMLRLPDGSIKFLAQSVSRIRIDKFIQLEPYPIADITELMDVVLHDDEESALMRGVLQAFEEVISISLQVPEELRLAVINTTAPGRLADLIASNLNIPSSEKQLVLETIDVKSRLKKVADLLKKEYTVVKLAKEIQRKTAEEVEKEQREYFLREQLRQIKRELGEEDFGREIEEIRLKIDEAHMPEEARKTALSELSRLAKMNPSSAEYTVSRTYLDWLVEMPWSKSTEDRIDIAEARKILDEDHYDLDEVKKRILEFLAVRKLKPDVKSPIILFVGPPGVGKTSLGMSIARAMGRKFIRISLGGMKDEAEIRGHRRTYVGALPGRIIQGIKRAGSNNPVYMLDEIDKIGQEFRGDPASALLEVLDPEQNSTFEDHYLDVKFDLSKVIFIGTANYIDPIPQVLLDRMEVIRLPGYTDIEKFHIAKKFLIPKELDSHGLTKEQIAFTNEGLNYIINSYTREAGVRNLDRAIASICRKVAMRIAEGSTEKQTITPELVREFLGPEMFLPDKLLKEPKAGVVTGLAWTPFGGEVLTVEALSMPGQGKLVLTGSLGDVMKESAEIALSWTQSQAENFKIDPELFHKSNFHIHVPAGAIPKDGPSAGITIATALVSLLLNIPPHQNIAMTGEITLRGDVLPVGGLKEKALAAHRVKVKKVLIPRENQKDVPELPEEIRNEIKFVPVETMDDVLKLALGIRIEEKAHKTKKTE